MWLVLCEPADEAALWAVVGLRRLGLDPVEVVVGEELLAGAIAHAVGRGGASLSVHLPDGREIRSEEVRGVLNRLVDVPSAWLHRFGPEDQAYMAEEAHALLVSALHAFACPVLNPPQPAGLCGALRDDAQWRLLAAAAGLPAVPYGEATWADPPVVEAATTALVVGGEVVGGDPALAALAGLAATPLLGVGLDAGGRVRSATPLPDLRRAGQPGLDALAEALAA